MRRRHFAVCLLGLLLTSGCGAALLTNVQVAGVYALSTVNGQALPVTLQAANPRVDLIAVKLTINAGGGFSQQRTQKRSFADGTSSTEIVTESGSFFTVDGGVNMSFNDGSVSVGDVDGNKLTFTVAGAKYVYLKE